MFFLLCNCHLEAKDKLEILLEIFPRSAYIHTMAALSAYDREEIDKCIHHFRQIRVEDSKQITGMDKYALLLYSQCLNLLSLPAVSSADQCLITLPRISGDISRMGIDVTGYREELCRLATEMMSDFPRHPISWSCAALYTDLRGDKDKAMLFIEKVQVFRIFLFDIYLGMYQIRTAFTHVF